MRSCVKFAPLAINNSRDPGHELNNSHGVSSAAVVKVGALVYSLIVPRAIPVSLCLAITLVTVNNSTIVASNQSTLHAGWVGEGGQAAARPPAGAC